jgi:hypothetical protein
MIEFIKLALFSVSPAAIREALGSWSGPGMAIEVAP